MRCRSDDAKLPPSVMEKKTAHGLLKLLDQRRVFRHDNYSKLEEILKDIQRDDLVYRYLSSKKESSETTGKDRLPW